MSEQRPLPPARGEQLLDLLLDALLERQASRLARPAPSPQPSAPASPPPAPAATSASAVPHLQASIPPHSAPAPPVSQTRAPALHLSRTLTRLALIVVALVVAFNVPLNRSGLNLAHLAPSSASLIIRDGLVLKGSGPEIYVLEDNKLRWISSLDAFQFFGFRWEQVHAVDDSFLQQFEMGRPLDVLLKCQSSPHIYALQNDHKRWIKDIPTLTAEGYVWSDVQFVDCDYLRSLPDGPPIPEDAGPAPQP